MARSTHITEEQKDDMRAWLRLLAEEGLSSGEVSEMTGGLISPVTVQRVLNGSRNPGTKVLKAYREWDQAGRDLSEPDDPEPDPYDVDVKIKPGGPLDRKRTLYRPSNQKPPCAADVLGEAEDLIRRARELVRDPGVFRPLLRPGIETLAHHLEEALELLEFG